MLFLLSSNIEDISNIIEFTHILADEAQMFKNQVVKNFSWWLAMGIIYLF